MSTVVKCTLDNQDLKPLLEAWGSERNGKEFSVVIDIPQTVRELQELIVSPSGEVFLLIVDHEIVGLMAVYITSGHLVSDLVCKDRHVYILPDYRKNGNANKLIQSAENYAKERNCKYIGLTVSTISGARSDIIKRFYERLGYREIETSFLKEIHYG